MDCRGSQPRADIEISSMFGGNTTKTKALFVLIHIPRNPAPNKSHNCDGQTAGQETGAKGDLLNATGGRRTNSPSHSLGFVVQPITTLTAKLRLKQITSRNNCAVEQVARCRSVLNPPHQQQGENFSQFFSRKNRNQSDLCCKKQMHAHTQRSRASNFSTKEHSNSKE